jgi:hypothetical protein
MKRVAIIPHNVISGKELKELSLDKIPLEGDPLEIDEELYFVCDKSLPQATDSMAIGVIPLVVRNPADVSNIKEYIKCLSIAQRRVKFRNENGFCDFTDCNEMIIS